MLFVFRLFDQESKYLLQLWETSSFKSDTNASAALKRVKPVKED